MGHVKAIFPPCIESVFRFILDHICFHGWPREVRGLTELGGIFSLCESQWACLYPSSLGVARILAFLVKRNIKEDICCFLTT